MMAVKIINKQQTKRNVYEDVEKLEPCGLLVKKQTSVVITEHSLGLVGWLSGLHLPAIVTCTTKLLPTSAWDTWEVLGNGGI